MLSEIHSAFEPPNPWHTIGPIVIATAAVGACFFWFMYGGN